MSAYVVGLDVIGGAMCGLDLNINLHNVDVGLGIFCSDVGSLDLGLDGKPVIWLLFAYMYFQYCHLILYSCLALVVPSHLSLRGLDLGFGHGGIGHAGLDLGLNLHNFDVSLDFNGYDFYLGGSL